MKQPEKSELTRRGMLTGLAAVGVGTAAVPGLAADRPMISAGRVTGCDNAGVAVSRLSGRIAASADFAGAGRCDLSRDTVEGPYFICTDTMNARNIAEGVIGTPMTLSLRVTDQACEPIPGAIVDVWQCDARGNYSGHTADPDSPNPARQRGRRREPDAPTRFLRGVLAADAEGIVEFDTIYPGFYGERAVHTHYKVHVGNTAHLTSQALYPEEWNDRIFNDPLYSEGRGARRVPNADDSFGRSGGLFAVRERGGRLLATLNLSIPT